MVPSCSSTRSWRSKKPLNHLKGVKGRIWSIRWGGVGKFLAPHFVARIECCSGHVAQQKATRRHNQDTTGPTGRRGQLFAKVHEQCLKVFCARCRGFEYAPPALICWMFLQFDWYVQLHVVRWLKDALSETLAALKQHTAKNTFVVHCYWDIQVCLPLPPLDDLPAALCLPAP